MNQRSALVLLLVAMVVRWASAQTPVVFSTPFTPSGKGAVRSHLLEDKATGEHLLLACDGPDLHVYLLGADWSVKDRFKTALPKDSNLPRHFGLSHQSARSGGTWALFANGSRSTQAELIDVAGRKASVVQAMLADKVADLREIALSRPEGEYLLYVRDKQRDGMMLARLSGDGKVTSTALKLGTNMPRAEKKKPTPEELAYNLRAIKPGEGDLRNTRSKVQLYSRPEGLVVSVAQAAEAELTTYDPSTGASVSQRYFSVADLLPEGTQAAKAGTVTLLDGGYLWLLASTRSGGALASFELTTGQRVSELRYDAAAVPRTLGFPPTAYETMPDISGNMNEKTNEVDMKTFCADLARMDNAMLMRPVDKDRQVLIFGGWEQKSGPTSVNRPNTTPDWVAHTTAGVLVNAFTGTLIDDGISWSEAHRRKEAGSKYERSTQPTTDLFSFYRVTPVRMTAADDVVKYLPAEGDGLLQVRHME